MPRTITDRLISGKESVKYGKSILDPCGWKIYKAQEEWLELLREFRQAFVDRIKREVEGQNLK